MSVPETKFVTILRLSKKPTNETQEDQPQKISFLPNDCFFQFSFLLEIDLSYNNLTFLPLSISQCFLLERVNIAHNPISSPPLVLFSLPQIRKHPENLIFGNDQQCTRKIMLQTLKQSQSMNQLVLQFIEPNTSVTILSVAPETTLHDLLVLSHPQLANISNYLFIVRTYKQHHLYLTPDSMPIAPYFYPQASWSIELRFIPPIFNVSIVPLLRHYVIEQLLKFKNDTFLQHCQDMIPLDIDATDQDLKKIAAKFQESPLLSACHYTAYLEDGKQLDIAATNECISIREQNSSNYIVMKPNSISFDCVNTIFLMVCGQNAVKLNKSTAADLLPLFALAVEKWDSPPSEDDLLSDMIIDAEEAIQSLPNKTTPPTLNEATIDTVLSKLKHFEGENVMFAPKR